MGLDGGRVCYFIPCRPLTRPNRKTRMSDLIFSLALFEYVYTSSMAIWTAWLLTFLKSLPGMENQIITQRSYIVTRAKLSYKYSNYSTFGTHSWSQSVTGVSCPIPCAHHTGPKANIGLLHKCHVVWSWHKWLFSPLWPIGRPNGEIVVQ